MPLVGSILTKRRVKFPDNVLYGDVCKGLPVQGGSCKAVYASHVLEHLSLNDFKKAIEETFRITKKGGIFRAVVPDLKIIAIDYVRSAEKGSPTASYEFMRESLLGVETRDNSVKGRLVSCLGNSDHLWMWDEHSLSSALLDVGFSSVRAAKYGDSADLDFQSVEEKSRFERAVAIEAVK